jgi:hypothetical protein
MNFTTSEKNKQTFIENDKELSRINDIYAYKSTQAVK